MVILFYFSFIYLGLMVSNTISILDDVRVVYINSNTTDVTRGGRSAFPSILEHLSTQPCPRFLVRYVLFWSTWVHNRVPGF
jgi:hypothetical protein